MPPEISKDILNRLAEFDSCSIADAIETFEVRLRNEGFNDPTIRCFFPQFAPMIGYAFTFRVKSSDPPMKPDFYLNRMTWTHLEASSVPKVIVIEDIGTKPGRGALVGKTQATILKALGSVGVITNGAIRGVRQFQRLRMPAFASNLSVSHAYVHLVDIGTPVSIAGVHINPGDLIHGDANGIVNIPLELVAHIPEVAEKLKAREQEVTRFCGSDAFSLSELSKIVENGRPKR
jgi:4-hydroxy-4-methyl-2-oxoglutarate aldolase